MLNPLRWIRFGLGQSLPTVGKDHRGQVRAISGNGSTTDDQLYFGRSNAGTMQWVMVIVSDNGATAARPASPVTGQFYFDATLGIPIWYSGSNWVNSVGMTV